LHTVRSINCSYLQRTNPRNKPFTVVDRPTSAWISNHAFMSAHSQSSSSIPSTQSFLVECCHELETCRQCLRLFGNWTLLQVGLMWPSKAAGTIHLTRLCMHFVFARLQGKSLPD
jgi:hypothetical protein